MLDRRSAQTAAVLISAESVESAVVFHCLDDVPARVVVIQSVSDSALEILTVCEVEVFGGTYRCLLLVRQKVFEQPVGWCILNCYSSWNLSVFSLTILLDVPVIQSFVPIPSQ